LSSKTRTNKITISRTKTEYIIAPALGIEEVFFSTTKAIGGLDILTPSESVAKTVT